MRTVIGVGACALAGGCFEPQIRDGQIACELDTSCPEGFVCIDELCRNTAPTGKDDDPLDPGDTGDGGGDDVPADSGPRIFTASGGVFTSVSAADELAGSAVDPTAVQTGFALCDGDVEIRCWADAETVACDFGEGFVDASWRDLGGDRLAALSPTFGAAMTFDGVLWSYYFHRGPAWQGFDGLRLESDGATIGVDLVRFADSADNADDLDTIYAGDPNAPDSFSAIVWDYIEIDASGSPWHFVDADGRRFTVRLDGTSASSDDPYLALPGAPDDDDVVAASMCDGELQLYAID